MQWKVCASIQIVEGY